MSDFQHTVHPDVHTHGLADDCPRCSEHAENPFAGLDETVFGNLVDLAAADDRLSRLRSTNEGIAAKNVLNAMERFGRVASTRPLAATKYLARWGVDAIYVGETSR